jgi:predicted nucleic acid-binding protein
MIVVDTCGWLEYIQGSDRAELFAPAIERPEQLIVPTVTMLEVAKILSRHASKDEVMKAISVMRMGTVVDLTEEIALDAAILSGRFRMPSVDAIVLATAQHRKSIVWTQDADFDGKPGVKYFPKP